MNFLEEFCGDSLSVRTLSSKRCSAATRCHEEIFWQRSCGHRNSSSIEEGRMVNFVVGFVGLGLFGWSGTFRPEYQRPEIFQGRSEEHTSELQSLMRISYAVFCLKKKNTTEHPLISRY